MSYDHIYKLYLGSTFVINLALVYVTWAQKLLQSHPEQCALLPFCTVVLWRLWQVHRMFLFSYFPQPLPENSRENAPVWSRANPSKCFPIHHYHSSWPAVFQTASVVGKEERKRVKKVANKTWRYTSGLYNNFYENYIIFINCNFYLRDEDQFIERWNSPVERIPHCVHRFVVCHDAYWWLDGMKHNEHKNSPHSERLNERDPSCRCQLSGVSVCGRQIFPREAVC